MKAEIITIGDEILIGQIVDTNSQWIGVELNKIGVSVYQITSIQDEKQHILNALKEAQERVDIVILTGGLGPTKDDITKKTIAEYFNDTKLVEYPKVVEHIKELFQKINHPFKEIQRLMTNEVLPRIQKQFKLSFISHKTIMTYGQGESVIAERIAEVEDNLPENIKLAYLPSFGKVRLRLSGNGNDKEILELVKLI